MERSAGKGPVDPTQSFEQVRYSNLEGTNEGLGSANQSFFIDHSTSINTNTRPPDYNMSVGTRPVLNYSIQTGEEFAFEFMRERVNPRPQAVPAAYRDPSNTTGYMDLKAILGISLAGSESGSDISMITSAEKGFVSEYDRKGPAALEDRSYRDSTRSVARAASRNNGSGSSRGLASSMSGAYDGGPRKVKFLCSFGGKILPRPSDGKLRYVGGETRIVRISRDISWQELMQKTMAIFNQVHTIKYQLPGEDLDALVSVSCDEDLQNMMEECNVLEDGGSQKPRMFLFSSSDLEDAQFGIGSMEGDSEVQYVVAVNGMDVGSRRNSIALASASGTNLDELGNLNAERDASQVRGEFAGNGPSAGVQSSQPLPSTSAGSHDSNLQSFQRKNDNLGNGGLPHHPLSAPQLGESFSQVEGKRAASSSVSLLHDPGSRTSNYGATGENVIQMPLHGLPVAWGVMGEEHHQLAARQMQDAKVHSGEGRLKRDSSAKKVTESDKIQVQEKEVSFDETKMKRVGSRQRMDDTSHEGIPLHANDGFVPRYASREEASAVHATTEVKIPPPTKIVNKNQVETVKSPMNPEDVNPIFASDPTDLSYLESTGMPQRVFHSERIPREQSEQYRLSKSDDPMNPHLLINQALSEHSHVTPDAVDYAHEGAVASQAEQTGAYSVATTTQDSTKQFHRQTDSADVFHVNRNASEDAVEAVPTRKDNDITLASGLQMSSQMTSGKLHATYIVDRLNKTLSVIFPLSMANDRRIKSPVEWFKNGLVLSFQSRLSRSRSRSISRSSSSPSNSRRDELRGVFAHFDTDGDGKISASELREYFRSVGETLTLGEARGVIDETDTDEDGLIDFDDFARLMKMDGGGQGSGGRVDEEEEDDLRRAFEMFEHEKGSGCITPKGLQMMLRKLGDSRTFDDCVEMIRVYDIDGNGVLDFHEFHQMMA